MKFIINMIGNVFKLKWSSLEIVYISVLYILKISNINDLEMFGNNIVFEVKIFVIKYLMIRLKDKVSVLFECLFLWLSNVKMIIIVIFNNRIK